MGVQGFQDYIEKHCPSAVVPVELQKLARGSLVGGGRQRPPQTPLRLLIDADNCLHRLYGGFYTDWVSGGQWNHMLGYLAALAKACFNGNIELFVFFNGALEKARLHEWVKRQGNERQTAQQIVSHVQNKGTPPPKVWFLPPVCMAHCIRLALIRFHIKVSPGPAPSPPAGRSRAPPRAGPCRAGRGGLRGRAKMAAGPALLLPLPGAGHRAAPAARCRPAGAASIRRGSAARTAERAPRGRSPAGPRAEPRGPGPPCSFGAGLRARKMSLLGPAPLPARSWEGKKRPRSERRRRAALQQVPAGPARSNLRRAVPRRSSGPGAER